MTEKTDYTSSDLKAILRGAGLRASSQRLSVLKFLLENQNHPTAEEILLGLNQDNPTLSRATVYNSLSAFVDKDLVYLLEFKDAESRYDINTFEHGHFKCRKCGAIKDVPFGQDLAWPQLADCQVERRSLLLTGVCDDCLSHKAH